METIRLFKVFMSESAGQAAHDVLYSGYIGEGEKVVEFESAIADVVKNDNVLSMNSGTSAIMMALRLAGVGYRDYVISTPATCIATNEPILAMGATPIWTDVDKATGNMTVETLRKAIDDNITKLEHIKAIMCAHWGGLPCDVKKINEVASAYKIPVIEDAAQALGATYNESMIGQHYSNYVCFSFQAIKPVTSVDGGAIVFKSQSEKERGRLMRWYGFDRTKGLSMRCLQNPPEYGYRLNMNDVNAAIGLENIRHLDWLLSRARFNASTYSSNLSMVSPDKVKVPTYNSDSTYWLYTLIVDDAKAFIEYMKERKIECSQVHGRNDTKTIFASSKVDLPGVDYFSEHEVCIPCGFWLSEKDVGYVIENIMNYCKGD